MLNRRRFLQSLFAVSVAPAVVKADSLMRVIVPKELIIPRYLTLDLSDFHGIYSHSIYIKSLSGEWVRHVNILDTTKGENIINIPLDSKEVDVWGQQLTIRDTPKTNGIGVKNSPSIKYKLTNATVRYDIRDTPFSNQFNSKKYLN